MYIDWNWAVDMDGLQQNSKAPSLDSWSEAWTGFVKHISVLFGGTSLFKSNSSLDVIIMMTIGGSTP